MSKRFLILIACFPSIAVVAQELEEPSLYVFVGEKITIERFEPELEEGQIILDEAFIATYRILSFVYNNLAADTITFKAYDHYGWPGFSEYETVLLYIVKTDDGFVHSKYLFSPLYKTKRGTWAAPYNNWDYNHPYNDEIDVSPRKILWENPPVFDLEHLTVAEIEENFPAPLFRRDGKTVTAVYGNTLQELFLLKKNGVLNARGYF